MQPTLHRSKRREAANSTCPLNLSLNLPFDRRTHYERDFKTLHALRSDLARERRVDHAKSIGEQRGGTTWSRRAGTAEERESASNADRGGRGVEEKEDSGNDPNGEQSFALCPQPNPAAGWRRGGRGTPTLFCSTSPSAWAAGVGPHHHRPARRELVVGLRAPDAEHNSRRW